MGRAIVRDPQVFLFDEPLSNLDAKLRVQMRTEIKELHQRLKTTSIYVTHDQIEAMTMADKIVVMKDGVVEQIGDPLTLYDRPNNTFVAGFIGSPAMNMVPGTARGEGAGAQVEFAGGAALPLPLKAKAADGQSVLYGMRPEHFPGRRRRRLASRCGRRRTHRRRHTTLLSFQRPGTDVARARPRQLPRRAIASDFSPTSLVRTCSMHERSAPC